jgi:hypothetical protein
MAGVFKENNDRFDPEKVAKFIGRLSKKSLIQLSCVQ